MNELVLYIILENINIIIGVMCILLVLYGVYRVLPIFVKKRKMKRCLIVSPILFWLIIIIPAIQYYIFIITGLKISNILMVTFLSLCLGIRIIIAIIRLEITDKLENPYIGKNQMGVSLFLTEFIVLIYIKYNFISKNLLIPFILLYLVYIVYLWYYIRKKEE